MPSPDSRFGSKRKCKVCNLPHKPNCRFHHRLDVTNRSSARIRIATSPHLICVALLYSLSPPLLSCKDPNRRSYHIISEITASHLTPASSPAITQESSDLNINYHLPDLLFFDFSDFSTLTTWMLPPPPPPPRSLPPTAVSIVFSTS